MPNWIPVSTKAWTNVYSALDITPGLSLMLQNIGQAPLAFAVSELEPTEQVDLVAKVDEIVEVSAGALGLWVKQYRGNAGEGLLVGRTKTDFKKIRPYTGFDQITGSTSGGGGTVTSHSSLTELEADDHLQYFNTTRGDARYLRKNNTVPADITGLSDMLTTLTNAVDERVIKVVGKGLSANDFTDLLLAKLNSLPNGSAGKISWADIIGFTLPTHGHTIAEVSGLQTQLDSLQPKEAGKGLSSNDYTTAEKNKLASIEGSHFKGLYTSLAALQAAVVSPAAGDYGDVDPGAGIDVVRYIWDVNDSAWKTQTGGGGSMTGAQIATALFAEPDTNNFSNSYKTKVDSIATGATANATDAQLRDRTTHTGAQAISTITGLQTALDAKQATESGKGLSSNDYTTIEKNKLAGISAGATANSADSALRDRTTHTGEQAISTVTGLQTALDGKQKVIVQSATPPANPQVGDLWIQI
ncbi:MAG TPA: hypothetical protein DF774_02160 [Rheinheimera sp.]|uniref:hypothetical protein n=1 Tax=Rheinheimera sp. TaxID=1869214 RepID=UPI000ECF9094|nr:hypothetical protein [Rheinheimera sp.]HCU64544.1 hypothetical protein [Rheinheimera sp.]